MAAAKESETLLKVRLVLRVHALFFAEISSQQQLVRFVSQLDDAPGNDEHAPPTITLRGRQHTVALQPLSVGPAPAPAPAPAPLSLSALRAARAPLSLIIASTVEGTGVVHNHFPVQIMRFADCTFSRRRYNRGS